MLNTQFAKIEQTINDLVINCFKNDNNMKLDDKNWENYSTVNVDNWKKRNKEDGEKIPEYGELITFSLGELKEKVDWMIYNEELNHKDIYKVPVFIKYDRSLHVISEASTSINYCCLGTNKSDKMIFTAPDSRPEVGEFWRSRGVSDYDCSGFVVSKLAGERLLRLVKYVLETDSPKSWLDFREYEPNWIQFKFNHEEFDLEKLHLLSIENGGVLTENILRECKK